MILYQFDLQDGTSMRYTLIAPNTEYTQSNTGHVKIHHTDYVGRDYYLEFDVTNNLGYIPALDIVNSFTAPGAGFEDYGWGANAGLLNVPLSVNDYTISNVDTSRWETQSPQIFSRGLFFNYSRYGVAAGGSAYIQIDIEADFPLFLENPTELTFEGGSGTNYDVVSDTNSLVYQISHGNYDNISQAINYESDINSIPQDKTYFINSTLKVNGHVTSNNGYCFQILPDAKICLYQDDSATGDASPNLHLIISQYPCLVKRFTEDDSHYTETSSPELDYWHSGYWKDLDTGVNYTGICSTNIPIFRGSENAQKYIDGELSESDALNGGSFANKDSTIGGELTESDIPTVNLASSGVGCYIYALSEAEIKDLMANYLYVTDPTLTEQIQNGLWYWGNNPIDFMIDCYYVPFSISAFYDTVVANMKFGTYQFINSSFNAVKESNGNRLTLFNTTFEGVYGDWRDYTQFKYDLYLPFVGFFTLDNYKYLNHTVKCEMMFDLSTHNVRYYLFVDGIITDRVDGSVGVNIPLMASDMVNKAKNDREAIRGYVDSSLGAVNSVASKKPSIAGAVGNVINATRSLEDLYNKATQSVEGSFSSSMNIYDISYAYVRITEDQMIIPDKVHQFYNYPSYYMGAASALSGYCEISDVRFKNFTGTIDEQTTLLNELTEGVIL